MLITSALIMGFAGSFHCIGMCSPLAMVATNLNRHVLLNRIIYNAGRILTYGVLGLLIGFIGKLIPFDQFQNLISIMMGIALLVVALLGVSNVRIPIMTPLLQRLNIVIKRAFADRLKERTKLSVFILGAVNGILPCGLTLLALMYCLTLNNPIQSFGYMVLFGIGTLPAMFGMATLYHFVVQRFNFNLKKTTTFMLVLSACLLIARVLVFHHQHLIHETHEIVEITICKG